MDAPSFENRRTQALARARPLTDDSLARLASLERPQRRLSQLFEDAQTLCVIGVADCVESARHWLNAGADALCVQDNGQGRFEDWMENIWALSDFLRTHGRDCPLWLRTPLFEKIQVAECLEAGTQTISIYPPFDTPVVEAARLAGVELVAQNDLSQAQKNGLSLFCATALPKKIPTGVFLISDGVAETTTKADALARRGVRAFIVPSLAGDADQAAALVSALKRPLPR